MMKKYKLIKEYPGSLPLQSVVEMPTKNGRVFTDDTSKMYDAFPEYWEEVIETPLYMKVDNSEDLWKNTVAMNKGNLIFPITFVTYSGKTVLEESIGQPRFFTPATKEEYDAQFIEKLCVPIGTKFNLKGDKTVYTIEEHPKSGSVLITWRPDGKSQYFIKQVNKFFADDTWVIYVEKPVLFVTEDGKEIRKGDKYYYILKSKPTYINDATAKGEDSSCYGSSTYLHFSTQELAQEYIDMNKPIYTKKQALEMLKDYNETTYGWTRDDSKYKEFLQ